MNWLKGDLAFMSNSGRASPKVSKGGVRRENWILAVSRSWLRCRSERIARENRVFFPATIAGRITLQRARLLQRTELVWIRWFLGVRKVVVNSGYGP